MTIKSCIKILMRNYVGTFRKIDVKVLTFCKTLITANVISKYKKRYFSDKKQYCNVANVAKTA